MAVWDKIFSGKQWSHKLFLKAFTVFIKDFKQTEQNI